MTTTPEDNANKMSEAEIHQMVTQMFEEYRERLLRMIEIRLHPELRNRIDPADVLQEAFIEALRQLREHVSAPKSSPLVWLRLIVGQELVKFHRRHLQTQKRNIGREISLNNRNQLQTDSLSMSGLLIGNLTSPSFAARRQELIILLRECLDELATDDREILSLRHFEQLSNAETAEELGIPANTASVRYMRALKKFRDILHSHHIDDLLE